MKKFLQVIVIALAFAVASAPAWALGLGQIQVKSRLNQPFLAHIPIISNDPAEIQELSAKLADPETFVRIGLPLPDKLVSDLQFSIETDDHGMPYVKVTSVTPVALSELDFLVEVEWSGGRLVRQYSALMTPPSTLPGTAPVIEAPSATRAPLIARGADPLGTAAASASSTQAPVSAGMSEAAGAAGPAKNSPSILPSGRTYGPIRSGETLGDIARAMAGTNGDAVETMRQLLALNQDAFIGGNLNRLKAGAVLRTPEGSRALKPAAPAEKMAVAAAVPSVANRPTQAAETSTVANAPAERRTATTPSVARPSSEARLKIVAPAANTDSPTTRSGGGTQGDGDMLQQQLQQANESIATKEAEINELKSRVAELEQLKNKQAQLIALKDTQLASAQKNVGTQAAASAKDAGRASHFPWLGLVISVLAVAALAAAGAYLLRRKAPQKRPSAARPAWLQDAAATHEVATQTATTAEPAPETLVETAPESARDDHEALSRIAKARACTVVGDKAGARAILEDVLAGTLLPETRLAAQQLLNALG